MCSRYTLLAPPDAIREYFAYSERPNFPPRYNIAPTQPVAVILQDAKGHRIFRLMRWGFLPGFTKDPRQAPLLTNARSETVAEKPAFRNAFRRRRCLLPADGFYEWTGPKGKRRPFWLQPRDGGVFAFAGIWECWHDRVSGGEIDTVAILTCPSNRPVGVLHDRMPVVIAPEDFETWLDCSDETALDAPKALLRSAPDDFFRMTEMHPKINDSRRDDPGVQDPLAPPAQKVLL